MGALRHCAAIIRCLTATPAPWRREQRQGLFARPRRALWAPSITPKTLRICPNYGTVNLEVIGTMQESCRLEHSVKMAARSMRSVPVSRRQDRWDADHMRTVGCKLRTATAARLAAVAAAEHTTRYAIIRGLIYSFLSAYERSFEDGNDALRNTMHDYARYSAGVGRPDRDFDSSSRGNP